MSARILLTFMLLAIAGSSLAQAPDQTGTGAGPASTVRAPNTTAVGQTKPPGNAGAPSSTEEGRNRDRIEKKNDAIETGICIGCNK